MRCAGNRDRTAGTAARRASSYTNIALTTSRTACSAANCGRPLRERGERHLDEWLLHDASGAPHEFNSATYTAVDIARLAAIVERTRDRRIALTARVSRGGCGARRGTTT
jgi:hypothetical protein